MPPPSPPEVQWDFGREWDAMLVAISDGVAAMRDGTISGSPAVVAEGQARMDNGLRDHFFPPRESRSSDGKVFRASAIRYGEWPGNAFDGRAETIWSAGDHPLPQWVEIDLGAPMTVGSVRLLVSQAVAGETVHRVTGGATNGAEVLLAELRGSTRDGEWPTETPGTPVSAIRYVRVTTLESPPIAAWREIQVLAPDATPPPIVARPTQAPTQAAGPVVENRLGDGRVVRASSATAAGPPSGAFDGTVDLTWNAGRFAPAWIEVDLGAPTTITEIRLLVAQSPAGETAHVVTGTSPSGNLGQQLVEFRGSTHDGQWPTQTLTPPAANVRYVRVETVAGPSWVAWREIEIVTAP